MSKMSHLVNNICNGFDVLLSILRFLYGLSSKAFILLTILCFKILYPFPSTPLIIIRVVESFVMCVTLLFRIRELYDLKRRWKKRERENEKCDGANGVILYFNNLSTYYRTHMQFKESKRKNRYLNNIIRRSVILQNSFL